MAAAGTPARRGEKGDWCASAAATGSTRSGDCDCPVEDFPDVNEHVQVWSKMGCDWLDAVVIDHEVVNGVSTKVVVKYTVPGVGTAQKTLSPTSPNIRIPSRPCKPMVKPFAETAIATCGGGALEQEVAEPPEAHEEDEEEQDFASPDYVPPPRQALVPSATRSYLEVEAFFNELEVGRRFRLLHTIGSGSFSTVRLAVDMRSGDELAVKIEPEDAHYPQLMMEAKRYKSLAGGVGVPEVHWSGAEYGFRFMAMELLGPSLEAVFESFDYFFAFETVINLAVQMLEVVAYIHSKDLLHRDLKLQNFALGRSSEKRSTVYCIDFGLAKRYMTSEQPPQHIPWRQGGNFCGTARYASIGALLGDEQSRRDDLEALGYLIVYLYEGTLPWVNIKATSKDERRHKILHMKQTLTSKEMSATFAPYIEYCRRISFDHTPNYARLRAFLEKVSSSDEPPRGRRGASPAEIFDTASLASERR